LREESNELSIIEIGAHAAELAMARNFGTKVPMLGGVVGWEFGIAYDIPFESAFKTE